MIKFGEKMSLEYNWGDNSEDTILHFFFQLIRDPELIDLEIQLYKILVIIVNNIQQTKQYHALILLYKLIGHTRDIQQGRGECMLAYMQIMVWYSYDPELAKFAFTQFVQGRTYGSWKDIKKFCQYIYNKTDDVNHPLIEHACDLLVSQLNYDIKSIKQGRSISLAAKWAPREKKHTRWLYTKIALRIYPEFLKTAKTGASQERAICKAKICLRKQLSQMNKHLMTIEQIMCNDTWAKIDPSTIPSKALYKYKLALQNKTKNNHIRHDATDRHICAGRFQYNTENNPPQRSSVSIGELVKGALHCYTELDKKITNNLWKVDRLKNKKLNNFIPIIDSSSSMERNNSEPLYNALGLGIRASEITKGAFNNRLIIFSATPTWIIFDKTHSFVDKVIKLNKLSQGLNSNIKAVFTMLIKTFIAMKTSTTEVKKLTLGIFSDMQIDEFSKKNPICLYENIKKLFLQHGFKDIPKILFWNVRKTSGFPVRVKQKNICLASGGCSKILNRLGAPRTEKINHRYPHNNIMLKCLNNKRYNVLGNKIISKI